MADGPRHHPSNSCSGDFVDIDGWLAETRTECMTELIEFLRIESISTSPESVTNMSDAAEYLAIALKTAGIEHVAVETTGGAPVVYGDWLHSPSAPTILLYGHYDVQPADPFDLWESPPFEPTVRGGYLYARGVADDKGQVHAVVRAVRAWLTVRGQLPVNVRLIFEGEEEVGSVNTAAWLKQHRSRLSGDLAILCDAGFLEGNVPALSVGLRGMLNARFSVRGPSIDIHSGTYGGAILNPATALIRAVSSLHDSEGRIAVDGFYDDVVRPTESDKLNIRELEFDEHAFFSSVGVEHGSGEPGYSTLERTGLRPSIDVAGLTSGFQGPGVKTIIPATAECRLTCRLVPDQSPEMIHARLEQHLLDNLPAGVVGVLKQQSMCHPFQADVKNSAFLATAAAIRATFGKEPVHVSEGGSIPIASQIQDVLGIPALLFGFTQGGENFHAPNEHLSLANYETGTRSLVRLLSLLGEK